MRNRRASEPFKNLDLGFGMVRELILRGSPFIGESV